MMLLPKIGKAKRGTRLGVEIRNSVFEHIKLDKPSAQIFKKNK